MATPTLRFDELVEAVDQLPLESRDELIEIIRRRAAERRLAKLREEVRLARAEYADGRCKTGTVDELLSEIDS